MCFRNSYVAQKGRSTSLGDVGIASAALMISQLYERRNLRDWLGTWLSCTASQSRLLRRHTLQLGQAPETQLRACRL